MGAPHDDRAPPVRRTRRSPDGEAIRAPPSGVVAVAPLLSAHLGQTLGVATKIATHLREGSVRLCIASEVGTGGICRLRGLKHLAPLREAAARLAPIPGAAGRLGGAPFAAAAAAARDTAVRVRSDRSYHPSPLSLAPRTSADHPLAFADQKYPSRIRC
jgi:hypothetical protein